MSTVATEPLSVTEIQNDAQASAARFLVHANETMDPREVANWSLAAKYAISVAVSCETILKIQNGGER